MYYILVDKMVIPAKLEEYIDWFKNIDNRRVIFNKIKDVEVSTIFLGIDHGFGGKSLFFETMVFGGEYDNYQERYATWEEAEIGHKKAVKLVSNNKKG